ncbi:hypothetical protein GL50803_007285 [Giardia duodenalis]|uniref:Uncharacterized protein n=1 Tax=Giardia intestinalis (strain ATCC 50803 / WB clone C6) TaxID=184922 RepID=D3KGS0_GIAIC|nr:hypothetical protein GL50803_007285 [Giardia intestinalis]KAE8303474.1 hypothetical protein GL50803_007285 [Giardia intestinalis]
MPPFIIQQTKKEASAPKPDMLVQIRGTPRDDDIVINGQVYRFLKPSDYSCAVENQEVTRSWAIPVYPSRSCKDVSIPELYNLLQDSEYQSL